MLKFAVVIFLAWWAFNLAVATCLWAAKRRIDRRVLGPSTIEAPRRSEYRSSLATVEYDREGVAINATPNARREFSLSTTTVVVILLVWIAFLVVLAH